MRHDCPVCGLEEAIETSVKVSYGGYWEPTEHECELMSQECKCDVPGDQMDKLYQIEMENPPDDGDY